MTHLTARHPLAAALVLGLVACATARPPPRASDVVRPTVPRRTVPPGAISPEARRLFDETNQRYREQRRVGSVDYDGLEARYTEAATVSPGFAEPEYNLGLLYQRQGNLARAEAAYREALLRKPSFTRAAVNLAGIERRRGQIDQAIALLAESAQRQPHDPACRAALAEAYQQEGATGKAAALAKEALGRDPGISGAYQVLLEQALQADDGDLTKLLALRAAKVDAKDPAVPFALARLAEKRQDLPTAVVQLRAALELRGDFTPALAELAHISLAQSNYPAAEQGYRRLIQVDPKMCAAHLDLGVCERALGHLDAAVQEYQSALACDPRLAIAYFDLGLLYHRERNDCQKGLELYNNFVAKSTEPLARSHPVFAEIQECQQLEVMAAHDRAIQNPALGPGAPLAPVIEPQAKPNPPTLKPAAAHEQGTVQAPGLTSPAASPGPSATPSM